MHVVERRTQAERAMIAGDQPYALAPLPTQRDGGHGATALDRHRV
jgi:hypothetical protein